MGDTTEEKCKQYVIDACWRKGYRGWLIGVNLGGVCMQWKFDKT